MKKIVQLAAFAGFTGCLSAQVFTNFPKDLAIIPRDLKINAADVPVSGFVSGAYNKIRFQTFRNGIPFLDQTQNLTYSGGTASFSYKARLKAGRYHYSMKVTLSGSDSIIRWARDFAVGDILIIQGQSNAVANQYYGSAEPKYLDSFIRSFGTSAYDMSVGTDTFWHFANGNGYYSAGCIGQWGLVLAKSLLDSFGIPFGILNGAVGGTSVLYHQRYTTQPNTLGNIYGRLLYRMQKAGIDKNVRSILYFQGESDGPYPAMHDSLFRILYKDWFTDYKGMQKNYLVQVRANGCGAPTTAFCEVQRQFEFTLSKLKVISSNGLNGHDGCHYAFANGYEMLGKQLAALLGRDLYGSLRKTQIDPPNIESAWYSNAAHSEIELHMLQPTDSVFADANFYQLFSVKGDTTVLITSGGIRKNKVYLGLNKGSCKPLTISYTGKIGTQPWVYNKLHAGLIGFDKIPVQKPVVKPVYTGCRNVPFFAGEDSITGYKYKWTRLSDNLTKNTAKILLNISNDANYRLVMYYQNLTCATDTFYVAMITDKTPKPDIGNDTILCNHAKMEVQVPSIYTTVNWKQGKTTRSGLAFTTDTTGVVIVTVKSTLGCMLADTLNVKSSSPVISFTYTNMQICPGTDTVLEANPGFAAYEWNGQKTTKNTWKSSAGKTVLSISDSLGCTATDSAIITNVALQKKPGFQLKFCPYDSVKLKKPAAFISWNDGKHTLPEIWHYYAHSSRKISLTDSNHCLYSDTVIATISDVPVFSLGRDTSVCSGNAVKLVCSYPAFIFEWNGNKTNANYYVAENAGSYTCRVFNNENCAFSDTVKIIQWPLPKIQLPEDTVLCRGANWKPLLNPQYQWVINGKSGKDYVIAFPGIYYVKATDSNGCVQNKSLNIIEKICVTGVKNISAENYGLVLKGDVLTVMKNTPTHAEWGIFDANMKLVYRGNLLLQSEINLQNLPSGIYYFRIENFAQKIILIR